MSQPKQLPRLAHEHMEYGRFARGQANVPAILIA